MEGGGGRAVAIWLNLPAAGTGQLVVNPRNPFKYKVDRILQRSMFPKRSWQDAGVVPV
jgi:hypothetical protein